MSLAQLQPQLVFYFVPQCYDSRPWCKFLEDCIRVPHCNFKRSKNKQSPLVQKPINVGRILNTRKTKKIKRGGKKYKNQSLVLLSANAEGLKLKVESLKNEIKCQNVAIFQFFKNV